MPQNTDVALNEIFYSRADYTALRAYCLKIPLSTIAQLYYSEDHAQIKQGLELFLSAMRADLIDRAIEHNPTFADILKSARQGGDITSKALVILIKAADVPVAQAHHPLPLWFKPGTAASLKQENIQTLAQLVLLTQRRGAKWWRSVPRIGALRASVIVAWLEKYQTTLDLNYPLVASETVIHPAPARQLNPNRADLLAPLGRFTTSDTLDGSQGINRSQQFCFIQARNDLQAIEFYLARFEEQPHTWRAYRKELERFLLWCILIAGKPLSLLLVADAERYKRFLLSPAAEFVGVRTPRFSERWKQLTDQAMSRKSQRHAMP